VVVETGFQPSDFESRRHDLIGENEPDTVSKKRLARIYPIF